MNRVTYFLTLQTSVSKWLFPSGASDVSQPGGKQPSEILGVGEFGGGTGTTLGRFCCRCFQVDRFGVGGRHLQVEYLEWQFVSLETPVRVFEVGVLAEGFTARW